MNIGTHADRCLSFIKCDLKPQARQWLPHTKVLPAVTLSRQTGCGAMAIAAELAGDLQSRYGAQCTWMVFDKNLVQRVLDEHALPKEVAKFMPEEHVSAIQGAVEELLGLHPSCRTLLEQTAETISHLADFGCVILVGRAANIITRDMKKVFHVRLIAPVEMRIEQIMRRNALDYKAARDFVRKSDIGRKRYLKVHYHADIDDSLQYDLVINTARIPHCEVAHLIGDAMAQWAKAL